MHHSQALSAAGITAVLAVTLCPILTAQAPPTRIHDGETARDRYGAAVAEAGDVDRDQFSDYIVGAHGFDLGGSNTGRAYVYSGDTGSVLWSFDGEAPLDQFGTSVAGAGDVNADGHADVIVGAPQHGSVHVGAGRAYVYSGVDGSLIFTFDGEAADDQLGYRVAGIGDVNQDRFDDLAVAANLHDGPAGVDAGRVYVYSGRDGSLLYSLDGEAAGDRFGDGLAAGKDINADLLPDLLVGATFHDAGGTDSGRAYAFSGPGGSLLHTWDGEAKYDGFACVLDGPGDLDCDGYADVLIGASGHDAVAHDAGRAYVFSGQTGALIHRWDGAQDRDQFGLMVAAAGDMNGDGIGDVAIAAPFVDGAGSDRGQVQVYSGLDAHLLRQWDGEADQDEFGWGLSGAGDVDGDGWADLLVGAHKRDVPDVDAGRSYLYLGVDQAYRLDVGSLTTNQVASFQITGATPGQTQFLAASCAPDCLDLPKLGIRGVLKNPCLLGRAMANVSGSAQLDLPVPPGYQGRSPLFQAYEQGNASNLIRRTVN